MTSLYILLFFFFMMWTKLWRLPDNLLSILQLFGTIYPQDCLRRQIVRTSRSGKVLKCKIENNNNKKREKKKERKKERKKEGNLRQSKGKTI